MIKELMEFKGVWRTYQQRVLDRYDIYGRDNKFHIIADAFLKAPSMADTYLSQDLKNPKLITIATYQALHKFKNPMNRLKIFV